MNDKNMASGALQPFAQAPVSSRMGFKPRSTGYFEVRGKAGDQKRHAQGLQAAHRPEHVGRYRCKLVGIQLSAEWH